MVKKVANTKAKANAKTKAQLGCVDYHDTLIERLKKHEYAVAYLNAALEASLKGDEESHQLFLMALRNVAEAQGNLSALARRAKLRRESLYRMLSENGNPEIYSFAALLRAMGFGLSVH